MNNDNLKGATYHTIESLGIKAVERPAAERGTFPRYLVTCDGITNEVKTTGALVKLLSGIYSEPPAVFVNAGKGITINFDR